MHKERHSVSFSLLIKMVSESGILTTGMFLRYKLNSKASKIDFNVDLNLPQVNVVTTFLIRFRCKLYDHVCGTERRYELSVI